MDEGGGGTFDRQPLLKVWVSPQVQSAPTGLTAAHSNTSTNVSPKGKHQRSEKRGLRGLPHDFVPEARPPPDLSIIVSRDNTILTLYTALIRYA